MLRAAYAAGVLRAMAASASAGRAGTVAEACAEALKLTVPVRKDRSNVAFDLS